MCRCDVLTCNHNHSPVSDIFCSFTLWRFTNNLLTYLTTWLCVHVCGNTVFMRVSTTCCVDVLSCTASCCVTTWLRWPLMLRRRVTILRWNVSCHCFRNRLMTGRQLLTVMLLPVTLHLVNYPYSHHHYHPHNKGGIVFSSVCLWLCLFVCFFLFVNTHTTFRDIITKFSGHHPRSKGRPKCNNGCAAGHLTSDVLLCNFGAPCWMRVKELMHMIMERVVRRHLSCSLV